VKPAGFYPAAVTIIGRIRLLSTKRRPAPPFTPGTNFLNYGLPNLWKSAAIYGTIWGQWFLICEHDDHKKIPGADLFVL
jgi:hypothetical protein